VVCKLQLDVTIRCFADRSVMPHARSSSNSRRKKQFLCHNVQTNSFDTRNEISETDCWRRTPECRRRTCNHCGTSTEQREH